MRRRCDEQAGSPSGYSSPNNKAPAQYLNPSFVAMNTTRPVPSYAPNRSQYQKTSLEQAESIITKAPCQSYNRKIGRFLQIFGLRFPAGGPILFSVGRTRMARGSRAAFFEYFIV